MHDQSTMQNDAIQAWTAKYKGRRMTLVMCGRILGGRYGETLPSLERYVLETDRLVLYFGENETLEVVRPNSIEFVQEPLPDAFVEKSVPEDAALVVRQCDRLRFTWYYYGRPQTPENLCEEVYEYKPASGCVVHREHLSWEKAPRLEEIRLENAEEMLRISPYPDFSLIESSP